MKRLLKIFLSTIALLVIILVCVSMIFDTTVTNEYITYSEAKKDRLFERGWLPEFIPSSSYDIVTTNDLDLNISTGKFSIKNMEVNDFILKLNPCLSGKLSRKGYMCYEYLKEDRHWVFYVNERRSHVLYSFYLLTN